MPNLNAALSNGFLAWGCWREVRKACLSPPVQKGTRVRGSWVALADSPVWLYGGALRIQAKWGRSVPQPSQTMRIMAEKYEQLARATTDPAERRRFGEYVRLYRGMEIDFAEPENAQQARERSG